MGSKYWLFLLGASLVVSGSSASAATTTATTTATAKAVTKKKVHHAKPASRLLVAHSRGSRNVLVPPPPAYMPSILPELQYPQMAQHPVIEEAEAKPENPYSKYIYTRDPAKAPTIVQPGKYVTVWNRT